MVSQVLIWGNRLKYSQNKKTEGQTMSAWHLVSRKTELLLVTYYLWKYMVFSLYLYVRFYSYMKEHLSSKLKLKPQDMCLWVYMAIRIWSSSCTEVGQYPHSYFILSAKKRQSLQYRQESNLHLLILVHIDCTARLFPFQLLGMHKLMAGISSSPRQALSPRWSLTVAQTSQSCQTLAVMKRGDFIPLFPAPCLFISHNVVKSEVEGCCCSFACVMAMHQKHTEKNQECMWTDSASQVHSMDLFCTWCYRRK